MSTHAWLVEAPGRHYLAARYLGGHEFYWTRDPIAALRFYNEAQADAAMMALRELAPALFGFALTLGDARPVEHSWFGDVDVEAARAARPPGASAEGE